MAFIVYILFSESCQKFYSGQTHDFENRLIEHNSGETKSIRSCAPWRPVWTKVVCTRLEAVALEKKIKSRGAARFLADIGASI
jgi:putative endonuclease